MDYIVTFHVQRDMLHMASNRAAIWDFSSVEILNVSLRSQRIALYHMLFLYWAVLPLLQLEVVWMVR
jgi:hypothetical protein